MPTIAPDLLSPPLLHGFGLGASLIMAIGAQNVFVLEMGMRRRATVLVASVCSACDAALIILGVLGVGGLIARNATLSLVMGLAGAAVLSLYGLFSLRAAWNRRAPAAPDPNSSSSPNSSTRADALPSRWPAILAATLAVSLLNPHVYLDTVVLVGGMGSSYPAAQRPAFALGACLASLTWFWGLSLAGRALAPLLTRSGPRRVLDTAIGLTMLALAWGLARGAVG